MAAEKPEGTLVLISFIGGSSYFQLSEQGPSFWREMLSENHNALRKEVAQDLLQCEPSQSGLTRVECTGNVNNCLIVLQQFLCL